MASKKAAQAEARILRKRYPHKTVNVKQITKGNWGCRFSPKGKRDTFNSKRGKQKKRKASEDTRQRRKYARGGRIEAYTMGEASGGKGFPW